MALFFSVPIVIRSVDVCVFRCREQWLSPGRNVGGFEGQNTRFPWRTLLSESSVVRFTAALSLRMGVGVIRSYIGAVVGCSYVLELVANFPIKSLVLQSRQIKANVAVEASQKE